MLHYNTELQKNIRKMVNTQEVEAQRQRLWLEGELNAARHVQQNVGLVPPRGADGNKDGVIPFHRPPIAQKGRVQHPDHMMYDEDDVYFGGAGNTGAMVLPAYLQD